MNAKWRWQYFISFLRITLLSWCFQIRQSSVKFTRLFVVRSFGNWNSFFEKIILHFLTAGNLLTTSYGATTGWAAVNFVDLQKFDTSFPSGPLSLTQATRVVSVFFASAVVGNLVFPYIVKKIGSKRTMFALGFPQIVSFLWKFANSEFESV